MLNGLSFLDSTTSSSHLKNNNQLVLVWTSDDVSHVLFQIKHTSDGSSCSATPCHSSLSFLLISSLNPLPGTHSLRKAKVGPFFTLKRFLIFKLFLHKISSVGEVCFSPASSAPLLVKKLRDQEEILL